MAITKDKKYYTTRLGELREEYEGLGWDSTHEERTKYLYPHGRNIDDRNTDSDGERKDEYILNNTALAAVNVLVSGLFSGITPPTEPWFKLSDEDNDINELSAVIDFYQKSTQTILIDMSKSNFYTAMELMYRDLVTYSISNIITDEDPDRIFNFTHIPNGQYYIDTDARGEVSAVYREFQMRARNVIAEYGAENVSARVNAMVGQGMTGSEHVKILHVIEKNEGRDITKEDNLNMAWSSVTIELGDDINDNQFLRRSGYRTKPNATPRWSVSSGNKYGNGPGDMVIGDVKQLQKLMSKLMEAIEKDINPPLISGIGVVPNTGPNEYTEVDVVSGTADKQIMPLYRVTTDISKLVALIIDTQDRIKTGLFSDLFFALSSANERQQTATEVIARQKELLRLLGPITQRITPEALQGIIHRCFDIEYALGRLPDIPEELEGRDIKVEIISSLTKAQELSAVSPIEQILAFVGQAAQIWPEAIDKVDIDEAIDKLNEVLGIQAGIIRPDEVVEELRSLRALQQMQADQAIKEQQAVMNAKELSQTDLSQDNALNAMLQQGGAI